MTIITVIVSMFLAQAAPGDAPRSSARAADGPEQSASPSTYTLGPGDQILIFIKDVAEIDNRPLLIDMRGAITLPLVGRIQASGMTPYALESEIEARLKKYLIEPNVA